MPSSRSWAILPATMELWGKRKITIPECASVWDNGTVLVCQQGINGSIKFKMPDDTLNREAIFSMMIEKHASKLSSLKYSKRTQMMRITW